MLFNINGSSNNGSKSTTIIGQDVKIDGKLNLNGSVKINGKVKGEIESNDMIIVGKLGNVESNIKAKNAIIAGNFKGDMTATGMIEIKSTGKFIGNIKQKKGSYLMIEKGGLFKGKSTIKESKN